MRCLWQDPSHTDPVTLHIDNAGTVNLARRRWAQLANVRTSGVDPLTTHEEVTAVQGQWARNQDRRARGAERRHCRG